MITDHAGTYTAPPSWVEANESLRTADAGAQAFAHAVVSAALHDGGRLAAVAEADYVSAEVIAQARSVCEIAASVLRTANAQIALLDDQLQNTVTSYNAADGRHGRRPSIDCSDGMCQYVVGLDMPLAVSDASQHALVRETRQAREGGVTSYLGVPVESADGNVVGSLCVWDSTARDWDVSDVDLLTRLARMLTRADDAARRATAAVEAVHAAVRPPVEGVQP